ncbi:hypothetical protein [Bradyrhizobium sp. LVM 105]|uniref:hypothetical protein n=1 Tax=Bradyrhizobium sp. LVM 105 TaxID=2341115 RepID=UPI0013DFBED0|nr:hypothetical protein [Bradyrhizobium sp. LVM 105]
MRFKIDFARSSYHPFVLFWRRPGLLGGSWVKIDDFRTMEEAKAHYELIKDLPEYLP